MKLYLGRHLLTVLVGLAATEIQARDWSHWRGPEQTGASKERAVVTNWSRKGKNLLWRFSEGGRSTPIVMGGRLFAILPVGEGMARGERVVALDTVTGKKIWEKRFNVFHTDIVENRVGWTSLIGDPENGYLYAHATGGEFFCFDQDGQLVWKISMSEELGRISGYGGRLHSPILDEDRVIVSFLNSSWGNQARALHRYVAFDQRTGRMQWWAAPGVKPLDTTYATPVVAVIDGLRMLIAANADGNVYGMLARNGKKVWSFRLSKRGLNSSVVVEENYAYFCHSEENWDTTEMGSIVCIDATKRGDITKEGLVWRLDGYAVGYASPAISNGRLYVVDNSANLHCIDAKEGQVYWTYSLGRVGRGSPVVTADGVIYVSEQNGVFHILRDGGNECIPLDREIFRQSNGAVEEIFGSPAVLDGRVYFMTRYGIFCLGRSDAASVSINPYFPTPLETARAEPGSKGSLQVVPAEITLQPGEKIQFRALYFDSVASPPSRVDPHWSLEGVKGTLETDGTLTVAEVQTFSAGVVMAEYAEGRKAAARVRVSPGLPISEDFESMSVGSVPPGWVAVAGKSQIVELEGGRVLKKLASMERPSPPFMRLRAYATPPLKGGYVVQADLQGGLARGRFQPDMGLINSRYRLVMMGMRQRLRVETWSAVPRLREDIPFKWDADKWYRVKFSVRLKGERAQIRAKVWPRDKEEPAAWHLEVLDFYPHREGSAGIYGYSTGTTSKSDGPEIFYDHFRVKQND